MDEEFKEFFMTDKEEKAYDAAMEEKYKKEAENWPKPDYSHNADELLKGIARGKK